MGSPHLPKAFGTEDQPPPTTALIYTHTHRSYIETGTCTLGNLRWTVHQTLYITPHQTELHNAAVRCMKEEEGAAVHLSSLSTTAGRARCLSSGGRTPAPPHATKGTAGPVKTQNGTKWHLWKHIQSCAVGGQYTAIYTDSSALCWNGQGHHQRALWANIFSLRKHFRCPGIKALSCFPLSCLMTVTRFLLLWFLLSLRPSTKWVSQQPKWVMSSKMISESEPVTLCDCGSAPAPSLTSK